MYREWAASLYPLVFSIEIYTEFGIAQFIKRTSRLLRRTAKLVHPRAAGQRRVAPKTDPFPERSGGCAVDHNFNICSPMKERSFTLNLTQRLAMRLV